MSYPYYVQLQAHRILSCIWSGSYESHNVCPQYLQGLDEDRFWKACARIREIMTDYYTQAETAPAALDLPAFEIEKYRNTTKEARAGNAALLSFPCALLSLGASAVLDGDSMTVDISALRKFFSGIKGKYLPKQLNLLADYGFVFDPFSKTLPRTGTLRIFYPDNGDVLTVLSAMGDKLTRYLPCYLSGKPISGFGLGLLEQFIFVTPGLFADNTENLPPKSLEHMAAVVGKEHAMSLTAIAEEFKKRGLTPEFDTAFLKNRFVDEKGKDSLCYIEYGDYKTIWQDGNEQLFLRLKLNHPDCYMDKIESLPPELFSTFTDVWCAGCAEKCNRRIVYQLGGEEKRACGCFFFSFKNPKPEDLPLLFELYDLEQEVRMDKS